MGSRNPLFKTRFGTMVPSAEFIAHVRLRDLPAKAEGAKAIKVSKRANGFIGPPIKDCATIVIPNKVHKIGVKVVKG